MKCPECESVKSKTVWTVIIEDAEGYPMKKRERKCENGHEYTTYECYEPSDPEAVFKARRAMQFIENARATLLSIPDILSTTP